MHGEVLSDETLVSKACRRDRKAFDALVLRYQSQAILVAQGILKNFELAKDASQNAFAKAYFGLNHFRSDAKFKTWFFRIVLNEAKNIYRKEKARGLFKSWSASKADAEGGESILELIPSSGQSPREVFEKQEVKKQLELAINDLPEREREVFILRYINYLSLNEVAETLGIALGTVKAHLSQGTEKLKSMLLKPIGMHRSAKIERG